MALEDLYFGKNVRSAIAVGQARGVAMLAAAQREIPCFDYTPQAVKMAVCGTGPAAKRQVQQMVGALLGLARAPESDHTADALAVAICHAGHARTAHALEPRRRVGGDRVIASVRGEVLVRRPDHVVVESGGVGYRLTVSAETLKAVPASGKRDDPARHLVVRDDSMQLYGFATEEERDLFLHLTSVSGVGPKVAIAILSGGTPRELLRAIAAGDAKRFQAVPGIGKRTAERVIVELREKVAGELDGGRADAGRPARRRSALAGPRRAGGPRLHARRGREAARRRRRARRRGADRRGPARPPGRGTPHERLARPELRAGRKSDDHGRGLDDPIATEPIADGPRRRRRGARPLAAPPASSRDFVNQEQVTGQLEVFIEAARRRGEPLDHVLLAGPPGLGKTSLAHIIAAELEAPFVQTAGPALERKADIAAFLTALEPGSVFFIDEIHRLNRAIEETLYPAMEDRRLPVVLGQGAGARTVTLDLPPFTLVGATTRAGPADDAASRPLRRLPPARALRARAPGADRAPLRRDPRGRDRARGRARRSRSARAARRGSPTGC